MEQNNYFRAILFFASEWEKMKGEISSFNIELAEACAETGRELDPPLKIWCAVPQYTDAQKEEANNKGVTLIGAKLYIKEAPIESFRTDLAFPSDW